MDWKPLEDIAAGGAGSLAAVLLLRMPVLRGVGFFLAGWAAAYFLSPVVADWAGIRPGPAGFMVGMFGMAIAERIVIAIQKLDASELLERFLPGKKRD